MVRAIIEAGVDVARLNLSHGDYSVHDANFANVRKAAEDAGRPVAVLVDLQGPKIRLGKFADGPHELAVGDIFKITIDDIPGTKEIVSTTFKGLPADVAPGDFLLIDDGKVRSRSSRPTTVSSRPRSSWADRVQQQGHQPAGRGRERPRASATRTRRTCGGRCAPTPTSSPLVRAQREDIQRVHVIMAEEGRHIHVIAKIEKPQAVENLEEIIDAFDGIMVARGDLGVELPLEAVPIVQKRAVELCRRMAKPVIVATQMLESMIGNPVPTRAETSDVANAVLDGADAVMLSGETSVGAYPVTVVETMARIVESTEEHGLERIAPITTRPAHAGRHHHARCQRGRRLRRGEVPLHLHGVRNSARRLSRLRPKIPMLAFAPDPAIQRRMAMTWGIQSTLVEHVAHTDRMFIQVDDYLLATTSRRSATRSW